VLEQQQGSGPDEAFITFSLNLRRLDLKGQQPVISRRERSQFVRQQGRWLYLDSTEVKDSV
jgi:uncharacterized protein YchJ